MSFIVPHDRPVVMGVLNVTPDSFSDGGLYLLEDHAVSRAEEMLEQGADLIDVGGESTRPGAQEVSSEVERSRVLGVVKRLIELGAVVSIDTTKAEVASDCLAVGAQVVNDVSALGDPQMAKVCAEARCKVCLMHMLGNPRTMQIAPAYTDVVKEVRDFLVSRSRIAEEQGIEHGNIWIDPGIGFGKTVAHNLSLIRHIDELVQTGFPVLVGVSKKSFIGKVCGTAESVLPLEERDDPTIALQTVAQLKGARIIRTHLVKETVHAVKVVQAVNCAD